jgi:uncharacterized protein (DUF1684 family)
MNNSPQSWLDWKASRNRFFSNPEGFLAITNLVWLNSEPQSIEGLSGKWFAEDHKVEVTDSSIGEHSWVVPQGGETVFGLDGIKVELASRGGQVVCRPRDPNSPMLKAFDGVHTPNYNPSFSFDATFISHDAPKEVVVGTVVEGMTSAYVSPGKLVFEFEGNNYELTAFEKAGSKDLVVYFKDATSGNLSYGTGRSVTATHQGNNSYILDFNYAGNFPCAYTDFATCPLAPYENNLPIAIEAGEQKPPTRNTAEGIKEQLTK